MKKVVLAIAALALTGCSKQCLDVSALWSDSCSGFLAADFQLKSPLTNILTKTPAELAAAYTTSTTYDLVASANVGSFSVSADSNWTAGSPVTVSGVVPTFRFTGTEEVDTTSTPVAVISQSQIKDFSFAIVYTPDSSEFPNGSGIITKNPYTLIKEKGDSNIFNISWNVTSSTYALLKVFLGSTLVASFTAPPPTGLTSIVVTIKGGGTVFRAWINGVKVTQSAQGSDPQAGLGTSCNSSPCTLAVGGTTLLGTVNETLFMPWISDSDVNSLNCYFYKTYGTGLDPLNSCS